MSASMENEARILLKKFLDQKGTVGDNYNLMIKPFVNREVSLTIGARLNDNEHAWSVAKEERRFIDLVLAAELFPDRNPPEILIAESESETHETLRERYSQTHPKNRTQNFRRYRRR